MLIDDAIFEAKKAGKLVPARPIASWSPEPRVFLMCLPLVQAIATGRGAADERVRKRWATLEGDIGHFVEGGLISEKLLKQLLPYKYEHWELISRRPHPSLRVFGRFAKPDVFIGTHVEERKHLGGMYSARFEHEKLVCEDYWNDAGLKGFEPFSSKGFRYEEYITENAKRRFGPK